MNPTRRRPRSPRRGIATALICLINGWMCFPFAPVADAGPGDVPVPNPSVAPDVRSPYYDQGYKFATSEISRQVKPWQTVPNYVASMGGPNGLCFQAAQIGWIDAQPLSGELLNPNVNVDQFYQGCLAATQTMLQTYR